MCRKTEHDLKEKLFSVEKMMSTRLKEVLFGDFFFTLKKGIHVYNYCMYVIFFCLLFLVRKTIGLPKSISHWATGKRVCVYTRARVRYEFYSCYLKLEQILYCLGPQCGAKVLARFSIPPKFLHF